MIDLLYLSWNRREFTNASISALAQNTDWGLVNSICFYDDCSTDGTWEGVMRTSHSSRHAYAIQMPFHRGSPVALMNRYIDPAFHTLPILTAPIFCKLDNDVIVPPGWLNESLAVMQAHPEVDLLGIEPGVGPDPKATKATAIHPHDPVRGIVPCDFIGGIGLMRRRIFEGRYGLPEPQGHRHGFTEWQERHKKIQKAWIAPGLPVVLLNRMPTEPWASLSREYVAKGWQREWPGPYREDEKSTWDWWKP